MYTKQCLHDIHSLLDTYINGDVFLSLNESRLEQSGVSLGFRVMLLNIIESLVCDIYYIVHTNTNNLVIIYAQKKSQQPPDNGRLSPQPESATSTVASLTTRHQPASPTAAEQQNLTKFSKLLHAPSQAIHSHAVPQ